MVDVNLILPILMLVILFMGFPLVLQFFVRSKTKGRHLCAILELGKPMQIKLLKLIKDDFVVDGTDEWMLRTKLMKPVDYPIGWPKILQGFQQTIWCSLVMRGRGDPLDWESPQAGAISSKELPVILDPHWVMNLVKGVTEEGKPSKGEKTLMYISVGASVLCLVILFYVISRLGGIEQSIEALKAIVR